MHPQKTKGEKSQFFDNLINTTIQVVVVMNNDIEDNMQ